MSAKAASRCSASSQSEKSTRAHYALDRRPRGELFASARLAATGVTLGAGNWDDLRMSNVTATGRCLCSAVSFRVHGPLRDVFLCHCEECRRWHGHVCAATAVAKADLVLIHDRGLRWIQSPRSDAHARRGFCAECGSSLFWDPPDRSTISIAAGALDRPTGLRSASHWFVSQAGDYYDLPDDGLPRHERSSEESVDQDAPPFI